jgi:lysophospholipase L1-like esterase
MNLKVIVIAVATACVAAGYVIRHGPFGSRLELNHERFYSIRSEIERTPHPIIIFGDSIVQGAPLPATLCGHAIINAGVVGAALEYFQRHAAELLGSSHPKLIVLAVGINNASPIAGKSFQSHYKKTVAWLSRVAPVVVATITPVRSGPASVVYDATLIPSFNDAIKATPNTKAVIDLNEPFSEANWTTDGIHFGPAGYDLWTHAMVDGVKNALVCAN